VAIFRHHHELLVIEDIDQSDRNVAGNRFRHAVMLPRNATPRSRGARVR
jgi:hypothetical protein